MKKKILLILFFLLVLVSIFMIYKNTHKSIQKIYLSDQYYKEEKGEFIKVEKKELEKKKETYILYTYNSYCSFPISCESIFEEFMETYHIDFVSIPFAEFKKTSFYPKVKYAPSIIIVKNQKVIAYLDANKDEDTQKYQDVKELKNWLEKYIYLSKEK